MVKAEDVGAFSAAIAALKGQPTWLTFGASWCPDCRALDAQRNEWLSDWADKKRTLTALYNARPAWLINAHAALDDAVAAAYDWDAGLSDDEMIARLLALNQERSSRP